MSLSAVVIVIAIGTINWLTVESAWTRARRKGAYRIYSSPAGLKLLYLIAVPVFVYGAVAQYNRPGRDILTSGVLIALALLCIFGYPATILISNEKIMSRRWIGLKRVEMNWRDVSCVYEDPEHDSIIIQDQHQNGIVHTAMHADRNGFIQQIEALPQELLSGITMQIQGHQ